MTDIRFPSSTNEWPTVHSIRHPGDDETSWRLDLSVAADCKWFTGHFPGNPVLPGVVQLHWAQFFARQLSQLLHIKQVKSLKFNKMVLPNADICLRLTPQRDKQRIKFQYTQGEDICSSGVIEGEFK